MSDLPHSQAAKTQAQVCLRGGSPSAQSSRKERAHAGVNPTHTSVAHCPNAICFLLCDTMGKQRPPSMASSWRTSALGAVEGAMAQPQVSSRQHQVTEHIGKKLAPWPDHLRWCRSELPGASGCFSLPVTNYIGFSWAPSDLGVMERGCLLQTSPAG